MKNAFGTKLEAKMDEFVHLAYALTKKFPKEETYGVTSQIRRASLSVILNYLEGYARGRTLVFINFLETSYGSLKESQYLLKFSEKEGYITQQEYVESNQIGNEIGAMLWYTIKSLKK